MSKNILLDLPSVSSLIVAFTREIRPEIEKETAIIVFVNEAINDAIIRIERNLTNNDFAHMTIDILSKIEFGNDIINSVVRNNIRPYCDIYERLVSDTIELLQSFKFQLVWDNELQMNVFPYRGNYFQGYLVLQYLEY